MHNIRLAIAGRNAIPCTLGILRLPVTAKRSCIGGQLRLSSSATSLASSGIVALPDRSLIRVAGQDAPRFLQGLTTNNVDPTRMQGWYTAFLNATGRVVTDAFVWPLARNTEESDDSWAYLLDVDASVSEKLRRYLKKHKLRSKLKIREVDGLQAWTAWNDSDAISTAADESMYQAPRHDGQVFSSFASMADPRLPRFSTRLITSAGKSLRRSGVPEQFCSLPEATPRQYRLRRFMNGVPEGPQEMYSEHYQAHPSNLDVLNAIDFRKGCYVGQELTIRTEHTGVVRKRILPVQLYNDGDSRPASLEYACTGVQSESIPFETKIMATGGKREAGKWIAGDGNIGLAMCRLESMTDLKVSAEGGSYTEHAEFLLQTDLAAGPKVKAFVPAWLKDRLRQPKSPRG